MSIYDFRVVDNAGQEVSLDDYRDQVLLIVNSATKCGFTPQYAGLQALYEQYHEAGLEILDFPCNQFAHQAPGSDEDIQQFCALNYATTFPRFHKVEVNGPGAAPLYVWLKEHDGEKGKDIKWNFTKFLVDRAGNVIGRYGSTTKPAKLERDILRALAI
jgi:glutathione peroxidase